jgi:hypothetical protein
MWRNPIPWNHRAAWIGRIGAGCQALDSAHQHDRRRRRLDEVQGQRHHDRDNEKTDRKNEQQAT